MPDWLKVTAWEIKRNLTNKTFIISMLATPLLILAFGAIPTLLAYFEADRLQTVYMIDQVNIYDEVKPLLPGNMDLVNFEGERGELEALIREQPDTSFVVIDKAALKAGNINIYTAQEGFPDLSGLENAVNTVLRSRRFSELGIDQQTALEITQGHRFQVISIQAEADDIWARIIPAVFAGMVLFSISIFGSMTFQSAVQEKKDKMAELLLSSITPAAIMQGKVLGYFTLGILQAALWLLFAIPVAIYQFNIPVFQYLFVPVLPVMMFFTVVGYLMFSALFVSMGATIDDLQEAGNFQGMIMILPWAPFFFLSAIITNPNGLIAQITSYFPLTSPGVMTIRLALLTRIPVMDVAVSAVILVLFTWLITWLAGKIFKTGMLMYGKSASFAEIIKWIRY